MGALSGKVIIVIITCISVLVISSIVIPIVAIYSGGETTSTETTNGAGAVVYVAKTFPENWDSKAPSVGTLLVYLETTA